jgi:hypothetical protein
MSYTTILAVYPGEKTEELRELSNAWGSAPYIWTSLSEKYYGDQSYWLLHVDDFFDLARDKRLLSCEKAVLVMTYDRAYVLKKDFGQAAANIRAFLALFPNYQGFNHWPQIYALFVSDPDIPAIGFHMTSVSGNPFDGPWNEETEDHDPLDWSTAYSVYLIDEAMAREGAA